MPHATTTKKTKEQMTLADLFAMKLKVLYDIESRLVKALPKMAKKATDPELQKGFERHARQTEVHAERLERAFEILGMRAQKLESEGIQGLIADAEWIMKNVEGDAAMDASLIAAAQIVEHCEIASYESAIAWATSLSQNTVADLLQETLNEEKETSDTLTELAQTSINERALAVEADMGVDTDA
jgi:ferritin-like metal-binding protein YciE